MCPNASTKSTLFPNSQTYLPSAVWIPSDTATITYKITPPQEDGRLRQQAMQCVVRFLRWNPKTNRISHLFRIISKEFKISSKLSDVLSNISPSLLFSSWIREAQSLEPAKMSNSIIENLKKVTNVIATSNHLLPLVKMAFLAKSHPAMSAIDYERLTTGSLLALSPPSSIAAQFDYSVEVWEDTEKMIKKALSVDEDKRNKNYLFLVKSFPTVFLLSEDGNVDIPPDSAIQKSMDEHALACKPLQIKFIQTQKGRVPELLSVDEEEGLEAFLQKVGLEKLYSNIIKL